MTASLTTVVTKFYEEYAKTTPSKLKLIDAYLFYILLTGVVQFLYCCLVGTFPFNSFLSGFISCVGSFVLAGKLSFILSPVIFLVLHIQHSNILIVFFLHFSVFEASSQSWKQRPVWEDQSRTCICWLHFCTCGSTSYRNELHWLSQNIQQAPTCGLTNIFVIEIHSYT
jgi:oligosaccharyltransferase complex subunit epsilon